MSEQNFNLLKGIYTITEFFNIFLKKLLNQLSNDIDKLDRVFRKFV